MNIHVKSIGGYNSPRQYVFIVNNEPLLLSRTIDGITLFIQYISGENVTDKLTDEIVEVLNPYKEKYKEERE